MNISSFVKVTLSNENPSDVIPENEKLNTNALNLGHGTITRKRESMSL